MKKFVNDPKDYVRDMLTGIALANPDTLRYVPDYNLIMRNDAPQEDKVSIIQACGSGHEPAAVMMVGKGMLDAACQGNVFASPPADFVYNTTKLVASPKGVLHLINNYTGDIMSFGLAREMAEAEGIEVRSVVVNDDVAVDGSLHTVGRRGVAGTFFVTKAVGAASEGGASLEQLEALGNRVVSVTRSMGAALTGCRPPGKKSPIFTLEEDEMEIGIGIHGEPGRRRAKLASASVIVEEMLQTITDDLPYRAGDDVAVMVNGMGGTPISELYLLYGLAHTELTKRGLQVKRSYVGEYMTSLEMAGFSLTLVKLDPELDDLLAAPAKVAAFVI